MHEKVDSTLGKVLVWGLVAVSLLVTPLWSLDPINPIKMLAVTAFGFLALGVLLVNPNVLQIGRFTVP